MTEKKHRNDDTKEDSYRYLIGVGSLLGGPTSSIL